MSAHHYSDAEIEFLRKFAWGHSYKEITVAINEKFNLDLGENQIRACLKNHKITTGRTGRFEKGHVPANKGTHPKSSGRMAETQFKKGDMPQNHLPVGSVRVRHSYKGKKPYVWEKVAEPNVWRMKHVLEWEHHNGPMPESLNMESGSMTEECIVYYLTERCTIPLSVLGEKAKEVLENTVTNMFSRNQEWAQTVFQRAMERAYKRGRFNSNKMYNDGRQYVNNYMKYGCTTWYDWCCNNWGTKWNAYSNEQEDEDTISFETAWSNPEPVMLKLSEMYPEAIIEHWWADEDMGSNDGYRVYQGGKIIEGDYCESCSNEAYEIYIKC